MYGCFQMQPGLGLDILEPPCPGISISGYVPNASVQHEAALSFDMGLAFDLFDGERALCPEDEDNSCTPSPLFRHAGSRRSAEILEETGADETQSVGTGDSGSIVIHSLPNDPGHLYHSAFRIGNEPRDLSSLPVVTDKDGGLDFLGLRKIYDTSVVSGNERRVDVEKTKTDDAWTHTPLYQRTIGGGKVVHQTDSHELRIRVIHRRLVGEASVEASEASSTLDHELAGAGVSHPCPYQTASKTRDNEDNKKISSDCTKPQRRWSKLGLVTPELEADGWTSMDAAGTPEVLLYIHGYNNSHIESLQILGQMAAFGNYPNHIRLFLFTWPAGSGFWQFYTARKAAEDPKTHKALTELLEALRDNGIREVHILCHSMGARVFLRSFTKIAHRVFSEVDASCEPGSINMAAGCDRQSANGYSPFLGRRDKGKLQLVTTTLLNPEYFLEDFVMEDYPFLRRFCNHITIFADAKDKALQWSERFSRRPALGKTVFGLWKPLQSSASGATDSFFLNAHSQGLKQPPHYLNTISFFHYNTSDIKLGTDGRNEEDRGIEWLDLDVIDTTFMDQNVHALRHSFWNLNRGIIEDIRELMVTRKRARQRTGRLDRRDGNVWVYRVAPSFLTSIFEVSI